MHQEILMNLGLSNKEADVYETLLRIGPAGIPKLLDSTEYKRGDLYNILDGLEGWELVELSDDGHRVYTPVHPSKLQEMVREQEKEVIEAKKSVEQAIPELNSMFRLFSGKPGVRFFEGIEGFREAIYDTLTATETVYAYVDLEAIEDNVEEINKKYVQDRRKKGIEKKILIVDSPGSREYVKKQGANQTQARLLPNKIDLFNTGMQIYNNKILYSTFRKKNTMSVIIDDPDIYKMQRNMFEFMWNLQGRDIEQKKTTMPMHGSGDVSVFNN